MGKNSIEVNTKIEFNAKKEQVVLRGAFPELLAGMAALTLVISDKENVSARYISKLIQDLVRDNLHLKNRVTELHCIYEKE